ncbi:TonB-dependent siderophore receptor [Carnimonas nigrificans]|uniref:TonB-dependent siderophore receptor n=1 Tax=Carnimonas nigrificans TaxID=64323 RepID=UPI000470C30A|nr:TonB-dependent siderophore receptor [Carnimonas nigrificans]
MDNLRCQCLRALSCVVFGAVNIYASPLVLAQQTNATPNASAPTSASEADADSGSTRLDTITVTGNQLYRMQPSEQTKGYAVSAATVGTKTPAALRDIPQSISVITRDAMQDQNFHTLDEVARKTPGLRILPNDAGRSSIYSRGYEYNEYDIDGLPAPMASINGTLPDVGVFDRAEILRGPSGLFNSTSELGGIVNMVLKRPTDTFQGKVTGSYGSWNQRYLEADLSGPLNKSGTVRGRMVVSNNKTDGFSKHNDNTSNNFFGTIEADLDDATTARVSFLRNDRDMSPSNGNPTRNGKLIHYPRNKYFGGKWNDFSSQQNDWIGELTHYFENGGVGHIGARYSNRNTDYNYAFAGGKGVNENNQVTAAGTSASVSQHSLALDASYSQPFGTFGNVSEFVVGTDYKRYATETETGKSQNIYGASDRKAGVDSTSAGFRGVDHFDDISYVNILGSARQGVGGFKYHNGRETHEEYGLYGKLTFRPFEPLALIAGGRLSSYRVNSRVYADSDTGDINAHRKDDAKFTPYAGMVLDLGDHHSLYASYSQVFDPQTDTDKNGNLIEPRKGEQYEVGIKGSYLDDKLNARVSLYRMYDKNRATSVQDTSASYNSAVGKTRNQGVEVEVTGSITPQWDVIAGYSYLDTKVKSGDDEATFLLMPKNTYNLWTQYAFDSGWLNHFTMGGGINGMSSFHSSQGVNAPGYATVDTMFAYDFTSNLRGQLNVNNIFDRKYYERVGGLGTFNIYGAPRSAVASLSYSF